MKRCKSCGSRELYLHEAYVRRGSRYWLLRRCRHWWLIVRCAGCWRPSIRRGRWLLGTNYKEPEWA